MKPSVKQTVAVLLPTYNGARFIDSQLESLTGNTTPFTVHWLDDHSTDETRRSFLATAGRLSLEVKEWHQPHRLNVPGTFFRLLECVQADVYLFCDQDDVWQPGKLDALVEHLVKDVDRPMLCFTDSWVDTGDGAAPRRWSSLIGVPLTVVPAECTALTYMPALGHSIGFTRGLRDMYMRHREIARAHAAMHSHWMYLLAQAAGTVRLLLNAPAALHRRHAGNWSAAPFRLIRQARVADALRLQRWDRPRVARQARGFVAAVRSLPPGQKLERMLAIAELLSHCERRQSMGTILSLARQGALHPQLRYAVSFALLCVCSDARDGVEGRDFVRMHPD